MSGRCRVHGAVVRADMRTKDASTGFCSARLILYLKPRQCLMGTHTGVFRVEITGIQAKTKRDTALIVRAAQCLCSNSCSEIVRHVAQMHFPLDTQDVVCYTRNYRNI